MALGPEDKDRTVIPNWRDFNRTLKLNELSNKNSHQELDISILRPLNDWKREKNIGVAADLVTSAFIASKTQIAEVDDAINYILENTNNNTLINLVNSITGNNNMPLAGFVEDKLEGSEEFDLSKLEGLISPSDDALFSSISLTRQKALNHLYNPIPWVELSRLYSVLGISEKADKAMTVAVNLAPNNRYVLRSATRLFTHNNDGEKAIYYLRKCLNISHDPWLVSAHIASSSFIDRFSPFIKHGRSMIQSKNWSNYDLTELASSLATEEYNSGANKKSKELFIFSLHSPNDNSLAQLEWVSKSDINLRSLSVNSNNVINPFEAYAYQARRKFQWSDTVTNCIKWFLDLPYTAEPIVLSSYVASIFLKNFRLAITICEAGLKANPNHLSITNNLIFSHALNGTLDSCTHHVELFQKTKIDQLSDENKVSFIATNGLIAFRNGHFEEGVKLYDTAGELAERFGDTHSKMLVLLNYGRELILNKLPEQHAVINEVNQIRLSHVELELEPLRDELNSLYASSRI